MESTDRERWLRRYRAWTAPGRGSLRGAACSLTNGGPALGLPSAGGPLTAELMRDDAICGLTVNGRLLGYMRHTDGRGVRLGSKPVVD
jgi:hypothetical protein